MFDVDVCNTWFSRFRGLMFKRLVKDGLLFVFGSDVRVDLHMLFVFYPIDILFLDSDFRVLKVLRKVKPFSLFVKGVKCRYVLEVRDCKDLVEGSKVSFINKLQLN